MKVPETLPKLTDGTGGDIVPAMAVWGTQYKTCRIRQHGLIDAVRILQEQ